MIGSINGRTNPALEVKQRPISKTQEEPRYGCDLAWLLTADVPGRYFATWVDLVQVKKSKVLQEGKGADSWRIEAKQLQTLLDWSQTAAYWLITRTGDLLIVPARHFRAIHDGRKREQGKSPAAFTVGYLEVRSAAISLDQYLIDLLIGQWVGTTVEKVVQFVKGENSRIKPRIVVEIRIARHPNDGEQKFERV